MELFSELNEQMVKYRFRPSKKMAQLFIIDADVISRVIEEAGLSPKDCVLEIGAGTGFLTREMQKRCSVVAVELDDVLFELLEKELPKKNLALIHGNFLNVELPKFNKVAALPPYTISSEIMYRLFELKPELCVLVFQKEFVEKLLAQPGFVEYNAMSVLTQYYFSAEKVCVVHSSSFFPKPNSDSAIVKLRSSYRFGKAKDEPLFILFVKSVFRFQNKNVANAVKNSLPFLGKRFAQSKPIIKAAESSSFAKTKVNLLSCSDFVVLFNKLFEVAGSKK